MQIMMAESDGMKIARISKNYLPLLNTIIPHLIILLVTKKRDNHIIHSVAIILSKNKPTNYILQPTALAKKLSGRHI